MLLPSELVLQCALPENKQRGRGEEILFEKLPGIFTLFTLPLEIADKIRLHFHKLHKIMLHPSEILRPKTKTPGNSTLFLMSPHKIYLLFLQYPWKIHILNPTPLFGFFFSGITQYIYINLPKTDDNDRAHKNDANILSLHIMVNTSFLDKYFIEIIQVIFFGISRRPCAKHCTVRGK